MPAMEKSTDREVRERLVSRGASTLSDAELLSIILGEGTSYSAVDTALRLLANYNGSLPTMARAGIARLRMTEGIGIKRAALLAATFELAERLRMQEAAVPTVIRTKEDVTALLGPHMARLPHEEMWALYLTSANGVIEKTRISQGGVTSLIVDYKLVVKRAVEVLASSIIIAHNHPSGVAAPSAEDISITRRISDAAALFDISLIDHIIITDGQSYSFRQHALIQ